MPSCPVLPLACQLSPPRRHNNRWESCRHRWLTDQRCPTETGRFLSQKSALILDWAFLSCQFLEDNLFWMTGEAFGSTDSLVAMGTSIWGKLSENLDERKISARTARCAREIIQRERPGWSICCWKIVCLPEGNACSSRLLNVYIVFYVIRSSFSPFPGSTPWQSLGLPPPPPPYAVNRPCTFRYFEGSIPLDTNRVPFQSRRSVLSKALVVTLTSRRTLGDRELMEEYMLSWILWDSKLMEWDMCRPRTEGHELVTQCSLKPWRSLMLEAWWRWWRGCPWTTSLNEVSDMEHHNADVFCSESACCVGAEAELDRSSSLICSLGADAVEPHWEVAWWLH